MNKLILIPIIILPIWYFSSSDNVVETKAEPVKVIQKAEVKQSGYDWAKDNDIDNFEECQDKFGTSYEEDECNDYVKENHKGNKTFGNYECTEDCSGHQAGYDWAERKGIDDTDNCSGNSNSFIEGCYAYVEENE
jgi:hypothetical protein